MDLDALKRAPFALALLACGHGTPHNVTLPPEPVASVTIDAGEAHATGAQAEFERAETVQREGTKSEAREAFAAVLRRYPYSRFATEAQLRIAQIDDSSAELEKWARDHASDPRSAEILAKLATVGDVTCRTDADCTVTTKRDCCECCPRRALATSKQWLEWRQTQQCAVEKCAGCDESCRPETGATAACRAGKCALVR